MRGRKIDSEFLSEFISECISNNKNTTDDILEEAKRRILLIDNTIREAEKLKPIRGKLLDVVLSFEKPNKTNKVNESKYLDFFKIDNQHISKFICDSVKRSAVTIDQLCDNKHDVQDIIFGIKQLLEHKIISKTGDYLFRGELFQDYIEFVLREQ